MDEKTGELIQTIITLLKNKEYIWFRFTWSKIGSVGSTWVVWLEGLYGSLIQFNGPDLNLLLSHLIRYLTH